MQLLHMWPIAALPSVGQLLWQHTPAENLILIHLEMQSHAISAEWEIPYYNLTIIDSHCEICKGLSGVEKKAMQYI